jgi:carbonic anhydrase
MRLLEAIIAANHRALAGDATAGLRPADFADALPLVALTCIDPRLNPLIPEVLGVPEEQFIWLRNAGNIITGPLSSTMRSLALACAVKGGHEIALIGHTDCLVCRTSVLQLTEQFRRLDVERAQLPENLNEFFGLFASERQNVLKAADFVRRSPLIGPRVPVHGLLVDITTGKLEWLVNGYETLAAATTSPPAAGPAAGPALAGFNPGEMKLGNFSTGAGPVDANRWLAEVTTIGSHAPPAAPPESTPPPPTEPPPIKRRFEPKPKTIPLPGRSPSFRKPAS